MMKVLACIQDYDLVRDLFQALSTNEVTRLVALAQVPSDGNVLLSLGIDVVLLDCTKQVEEAMAFHKMIQEDKRQHVHMVYLVDPQMESKLRFLFHMDQDATILFAPFCTEMLMNAIKCQYERKQQNPKRSVEEIYVSQMMQEMGIPVHLNGFRYIKTCALLLLHQTETYPTMKQLYKEVARMHNTTASRVEKAMRDAIDHAHKMQHPQTQKPTNSEMIYRIYEKMQLFAQTQVQGEVLS